MDNAFASIAGAVVGLLLVIILRQREKIQKLEADKERIERSNNISEIMLKNQISLLQAQVKGLLKMKTIQNPNIPPNTIQAVKYAMKHTHPDNGGNEEDFIKFQKCYEELTRKRG